MTVLTQAPLTASEPPLEAVVVTGGRDYVVLYETNEKEWVELGLVTAQSADAAVKKADAIQAGDPGFDTTADRSYVVVPSRSFSVEVVPGSPAQKLEFRSR